jgi:hypothetical protein
MPLLFVPCLYACILPCTILQSSLISVPRACAALQDFTELTRQYPQLMSKAMGSHNKILRKVTK